MTGERREARRFLALLDLEPGATFEQVKAAHRRLAQVWHPDRFESDVERRGAAEDRMKEINSAYTWLGAHRFELEPTDPDRPPRRRRSWPAASPFLGAPRFGRRWFVLGLLLGATLFGVIASRDSLRPAVQTTPLPPLPRNTPRLSEVLRFDQLFRAVATRQRSYYVHARRLSVRSLPGARGDVVAVLGLGDRLRGVRSSQGWVEVARPGTATPIGWVPAGDLGRTPPKTDR
jgi:hypothetical protein